MSLDTIPYYPKQGAMGTLIVESTAYKGAQVRERGKMWHKNAFLTEEQELQGPQEATCELRPCGGL